MTATPPLKRILRHSTRAIAVVALVPILFQPVRPHCGLPGYPMGPELDPTFSTEVLRGLHVLAEAGDGSFRRVFLFLGWQLYLDYKTTVAEKTLRSIAEPTTIFKSYSRS